MAKQTNSNSISFDNVADLYIRVSTNEQAEEGYSVGEQEARLRSYCSAMGFIINAVHIDPGYSGATLDRPGINKVIKDVKKGCVKKVIVWKLDRLSRSQKDTLVLLEDVFLENGCNFISIMESFDTATPFGRCIVGILAAFAQMERENIRSRMMMGKQAGLKEGNYYSGMTPIGYKYEIQDNGKRELTVDPFTSEAVKDMYKLYNSGKSMGEVGHYIQQKYGIFADFTRNRAAQQCGRIVRNPIYAGNVRLKDMECVGKHEALVTQELWQQVNDRLIANKKEYKRLYTNSNGLLSGLLFCGDCGARMSIRQWGWKNKEGKRPNKYICYSVSRCNKTMVKSENCSNRKELFNVSELDALIVEEIKKLSLNPDTLDTLIKENSAEAPLNLDAFRKQLENVEKQTTRLLNLYQTGIVTLEEIQDRLVILKKEREAVQSCITEAEEENSGRMSKKEATEALASLESIIESGDTNGLYALVHNLIEKVIVLNGNITIHWTFC